MAADKGKGRWIAVQVDVGSGAGARVGGGWAGEVDVRVVLKVGG